MAKLAIASDEMTQVRGAFEAWRRNRMVRGKIPERLWAAAVGLLAEYPVAVVARELRLNPQGLRERRVGKGGGPQFVECRVGAAGSAGPAGEPEVPVGEVRLSVARGDGSRLELVVTTREWVGVERLWTAFVRSGV